jgi:hypothetical protein
VFEYIWRIEKITIDTGPNLTLLKAKSRSCIYSALDHADKTSKNDSFNIESFCSCKHVLTKDLVRTALKPLEWPTGYWKVTYATGKDWRVVANIIKVSESTGE